MPPEDMASIRVTVDPDLKDLIDGYLAHQRQAVEQLRSSLQTKDYATLRGIGHSMKGSGGGYGFDRITELGAALEQAAKESNDAALSALTHELASYLDKVVIVYG